MANKHDNATVWYTINASERQVCGNMSVINRSNSTGTKGRQGRALSMI